MICSNNSGLPQDDTRTCDLHMPRYHYTRCCIMIHLEYIYNNVSEYTHLYVMIKLNWFFRCVLQRKSHLVVCAILKVVGVDGKIQVI